MGDSGDRNTATTADPETTANTPSTAPRPFTPHHNPRPPSHISQSTTQHTPAAQTPCTYLVLKVRPVPREFHQESIYTQPRASQPGCGVEGGW